MLKYVDNLIKWGDNLFCQLTRESLTQAAQLYMLADKLLGPKPRVIPVPAEPVVQSYNSLVDKIDLFSNALTDLENLVPVVSTPPTLPGTSNRRPQPPASAMRGLYLGIPANDGMLSYWDLVADRLGKIPHSQHIDGKFVSLTAPPSESGRGGG